MAGRGRWSLWILLQQLGQILLVVNQAGSSPADKTIRIGYLASYMQNAGAINVAIERAQNDGLLPGYNFRYALEFCTAQHSLLCSSALCPKMSAI